MRLLDPKNDLVFKLLLTRRPELLRDMLEGILGRPIQEVTVLNPDIPGEQSLDKEIVLDVRAQLADGSRTDVEMQARSPPVLKPRFVYYAARDYADQLNRGDDYELLTATVVVVWLVEPLFPELERLHSIFELRDRHTMTRFSDHLSIHLLQLSSLSRAPTTGYAAKVQRWARFLVADPAELEQLASEDPIMTTAKQTLEELSQDPITRRRARERADAVKLYKMDLAMTKAEGKAEGEAKVLLKLLEFNFGPLSEATRERVETATIQQLDEWVERVFTAKTLDEIFAP